MSELTLASRTKLAFIGLAFAVATLAGSIIPALKVEAATAVTNVQAVWNDTDKTVDISWVPTGVAGDTYTIMFHSDSSGGSGGIAKDASGVLLQNLTGTHAVATPESWQVEGAMGYYSVSTNSVDGSSTLSSTVPVTIGDEDVFQPASAPTQLNMFKDAPGSYALRWKVPESVGVPTLTAYNVSIKDVATNVTLYYHTITPGVNSLDVLTYLDVDLQPGHSYILRMTPVQEERVSPNFAELTVTLAADGSLVGANEHGVVGEDSDEVKTALAASKAPGAPNTGFNLTLANPLVIIAAGVAAVATLFVAIRLRARTQK